MWDEILEGNEVVVYIITANEKIAAIRSSVTLIMSYRSCNPGSLCGYVEEGH